MLLKVVPSFANEILWPEFTQVAEALMAGNQQQFYRPSRVKLVITPINGKKKTAKAWHRFCAVGRQSAEGLHLSDRSRPWKGRLDQRSDWGERVPTFKAHHPVSQDFSEGGVFFP